MGIAGAIVMGIIVFGVNYYGVHEAKGATTAALKQGAYTFLFGGIIMRACENLATGIHKQWVALAAAVIIPSAVAIILTFGVHSLKGTPKPVASTIPTAIFVIPSTAIWGKRKRRQYDKHVSPANFL
jgi:peptidoglycan/LPS O-acetylase OafA/YrhL